MESQNPNSGQNASQSESYAANNPYINGGNSQNSSDQGNRGQSQNSASGDMNMASMNEGANSRGMGNNMMNNNGLRNNSPMERARQNSMRGFDRNPYIRDMSSINQNPYNSTNSQLTAQQDPSLTDSLLGSFDTENFIKGALIGAVGAYLLTNENAQKAIFKTVAKGTQIFQAGMEEMKERYEDAKAEVDAE